jgi:hypothetical protein
MGGRRLDRIDSAKVWERAQSESICTLPITVIHRCSIVQQRQALARDSCRAIE